MSHSLLNLLKIYGQDTNRVNTINELSKKAWQGSNYKDAEKYANQALALSKKLEYKKGQGTAYNSIGIVCLLTGKYSKALENLQKSITLFKLISNKKKEGKAIVNIGNVYYFQGQYPTALKHYLKALKLFKEIKYNKGKTLVNYSVAGIYTTQGNYPKALEYYFKSLKFFSAKNNKKAMANSYNNIGIVYKELSNYSKALEFHLKGLQLDKELKDKRGVAIDYGNIGSIYSLQKNQDKAIEYHLKAIKIKKELGDKRGLAISYNAIGDCYKLIEKYATAKEYLIKALELNKEIGSTKGIAFSYVIIGGLNINLNKIEEAKKYYNKALAIAKIDGSKYLIRNIYLGLQKTSYMLGDYKSAYENYQKYIELNEEILNKENTKKITQLQMQFKFDQQQFADSIAYAKEQFIREAKIEQQKAQIYAQYLEKRADSILYVKEQKIKEAKINQQMAKIRLQQVQKQADSVKHLKEQKIRKAKIAQKNAEIKGQRNLQYALFGGLALVFVFAVFMFNRYKKTQKQKKIIEIQKEETEKQKQIVEEKNQEISDSITYAKRIQEAILPSRFSISDNLQNGFILFKPKDIVSGDFYWLEKVSNAVYLAAADCTGHGVPGAMVSVVCANALSKALLEENITDTGKLLDRTRNLVVERFSSSEEDVKDGMDISLCKLEGNKLQWSGANNPLWIIRNSDMFTSNKFTERSRSEQDRSKQNNNNQEVAERSRRHLEKGVTELVEVKPDKQPIGKTDNPLPFTTHNVVLNEGDAFYIFTDGYADQFGGEKGKKFKYKPMKDLLLSIQDKTLEEQKTTLNNSFEDWKGNLEQVDDVCVIGVRL